MSTDEEWMYTLQPGEYVITEDIIVREGRVNLRVIWEMEKRNPKLGLFTERDEEGDE